MTPAEILIQILQDIRSEQFDVECLDEPVVSMFSVEHAFEVGMEKMEAAECPPCTENAAYHQNERERGM